MSETAQDRAASRIQFVTQAGWPARALAPLGADASTRCYFRLVDGNRRAVLMDAPPSAEQAACPPDADPATRARLGYNAQARLAGPDTAVFVAMARWLTAQEFSAPAILATDHTQGFILMEDLGDDLFARLLAGTHESEPLYEAAVDFLAALHAIPAPDTLEADTGAIRPLMAYDATAFSAELALFLDWYWPAALNTPAPDAARTDFEAAWLQTLERLDLSAPVVVLRDFHAENLLWLPERTGVQRVGLLDFQDGLRGPAAYDLISLLTDARRDVERDLAQRMATRYENGRRAMDPTFDAEAFRTACAILSCQRNIKILGIFARLDRRDGKPRYLDFMARVWGYLEDDLAHPALAPVATWFDRCIPTSARGDSLARMRRNGPAR